MCHSFHNSMFRVSVNSPCVPPEVCRETVGLLKTVSTKIFSLFIYREDDVVNKIRRIIDVSSIWSN